MQVVELLADLLLKAAIGGLIVLLASQLRREVLLAGGIGARLVVGIAILSAVTQLAHQPGRRVAQVRRHLEVRQVFGIMKRRLPGGIDRIALGGAGEIDDRLGDGPLPFRRADAMEAIPGRERHLHGTGIGVAHVFRGYRQQPARNIERIATGAHHAGIPIERRIRCRAANGLVHRRDEVVEVIAALVETGHVLPHHGGEQCAVDHPRPGTVGFGHVGQQLQIVEGLAPVPIHGFRQRLLHPGGEGEARVVEATGVLHRLIDHGEDIQLLQPFEQIDPGPGEQRVVQFERGVLGGGADEGDGAVFDVGQEHILLALVEAVHLVHEEDGAHPAPAVLLGLVDGGSDLLDAGGHRREPLHLGLAVVSNQFSQRGLAGARRAPQDHGVAVARQDRLAQRFVGPEDMLLTYVLLEGLRPHPGRQRTKVRREIQR